MVKVDFSGLLGGKKPKAKEPVSDEKPETKVIEEKVPETPVPAPKPKVAPKTIELIGLPGLNVFIGTN